MLAVGPAKARRVLKVHADAAVGPAVRSGRAGVAELIGLGEDRDPGVLGDRVGDQVEDPAGGPRPETDGGSTADRVDPIDREEREREERELGLAVGRGGDRHLVEHHRRLRREPRVGAADTDVELGAGAADARVALDGADARHTIERLADRGDAPVLVVLDRHQRTTAGVAEEIHPLAAAEEVGGDDDLADLVVLKAPGVVAGLDRLLLDRLELVEVGLIGRRPVDVALRDGGLRRRRQRRRRARRAALRRPALGRRRRRRSTPGLGTCDALRSPRARRLRPGVAPPGRLLASPVLFLLALRTDPRRRRDAPPLRPRSRRSLVGAGARRRRDQHPGEHSVHGGARLAQSTTTRVAPRRRMLSSASAKSGARSSWTDTDQVVGASGVGSMIA